MGEFVPSLLGLVAVERSDEDKALFGSSAIFVCSPVFSRA